MAADEIGSQPPKCFKCGAPAFSVLHINFICGGCLQEYLDWEKKQNENKIQKFLKETT